MQAALDAAMEAAHSASANDAQTSKLRSQLSELTEINKTLLEKCKCVKADKAELEKQLQERDGALKLLEAKYRLLVKKFAPSGGSNTALPHQALAPLVYEL